MVRILTSLTSRSPALMNELRKFWYILDTHNISIRPQYIQSAANIWADRLSREMDDSDWRLSPNLFRYFQRKYLHTIDRFASGTNTHLPRYNSRWLDPGTEAVDCLRLSDATWRKENNWCHPPLELIDDLVLKLQRSGAMATVVVPMWPNKSWFQLLAEMASSVQIYEASPKLYQNRPGRPAGPGTVRWNLAIFRLPRRAGNTY